MMDHKREEAVWKRVMELSKQAPSCCEHKREDEILRLLDMERQAVCTYEALAACVGAELRQRLLCLARQARCHGEKLGTVFYLMTGKKACPHRPKKPCITCVGETLRTCYTLHTRKARAYQDLAEGEETFRDVLGELAAEEKLQASQVLCVLGKLL